MRCSPTSRITVRELHARLQADPAARVIDVRTPAEYSAAHVPRATSVPLGSIAVAALASEFGGTEWPVYVVCQSGGRSQRCVDSLAAAGFHQAVQVEGGTSAWEQEGFPMVRSAQPAMSLERRVRVVAGGVILLGCVLGWTVHPAFFGLSAIVGAGLVFAGVTDFCGMGLLLARAPWNRRP